MVLISEALAGVKQFTFYYIISIHKRWKRDQGCKPIVEHLTGMHMALGTTRITFPTGLWQEAESLSILNTVQLQFPCTVTPQLNDKGSGYAHVKSDVNVKILRSPYKSKNYAVIKNTSAAFRGAPTNELLKHRQEARHGGEYANSSR